MTERSEDLVLNDVDLPLLGLIAAAVAKELRAGDAIVLSGVLAAGKTQFVKELAAALNIKEPVSSPTFTLAHFYAGPGLGLLHVDAYRIETAAELADLTLEDFLDSYALVIEWGEKFPEVLPPSLGIEIAAESNERRRVTLGLGAPSWSDRANAVRTSIKRGAECD